MTEWRRPVRPRLLLALGATMFALFAAEVAARVRQWRLDRSALSVVLARTPPLAPGEVGTRIHILALDPDPAIAYGLRPGFDGLIRMGDVPTHVVTNRFGHRAPDGPAGKAPGTVRIVGIGDSVMFGHGLAVEDTYLARLQALLQEAYPQRRWEVINCAVFGYNAEQELAVLRTTGLAWLPDLVLHGLVSNDMNPVVYRDRAQDVSDPGQSFLADWLLERWSAWRAASEGEAGSDAGSDPSDTPTRGAGERAAAFDRTMSELSALRRDAGFLLLCFSHQTRPVTTWMLSRAAFHGLPARDLGPRVESWLGTTADWRAYMASELALSPTDAHPSALHARLIAEDLFAAMRDMGILEQLLERSE